MMMLDFRKEVEMWPLRMAIALMRNEKYAILPLFMAELTKFLRLKGNWGRGT